LSDNHPLTAAANKYLTKAPGVLTFNFNLAVKAVASEAFKLKKLT
jgi:hypothetical protein